MDMDYDRNSLIVIFFQSKIHVPQHVMNNPNISSIGLTIYLLFANRIINKSFLIRSNSIIFTINIAIFVMLVICNHNIYMYLYVTNGNTLIFTRRFSY